jgi:hypothetical protein
MSTCNGTLDSGMPLVINKNFRGKDGKFSVKIYIH